MVQLGIYSGLRVSFILSLKVGDVFHGRRFRIRLRIARKNLKGQRGGLDLPFHPVARIAIGRWLVHLRRRGVKLDPAMPVFLSRESRDGAVAPPGAGDRSGCCYGGRAAGWDFNSFVEEDICRADL
jgi:hypothetical protein